MSFVDNYHPARTDDISGRSVNILTALERGEIHIVVGYLVIKITALGFINVSCVSAFISVLALSAGAFDAYLFLDGRAKVEFVKVDQSFGIVQGFEFFNRPFILFEFCDLLVVFLISSLAEIMLLSFAKGYGKRTMDQPKLLKHLRQVWNFLFYDSPLKLDARGGNRYGKTISDIRRLSCNKTCYEVCHRFSCSDLCFVDRHASVLEALVHVVCELYLFLSDCVSVMWHHLAKNKVNSFARRHNHTTR